MNKEEALKITEYGGVGYTLEESEEARSFIVRSLDALDSLYAIKDHIKVSKIAGVWFLEIKIDTYKKTYRIDEKTYEGIKWWLECIN